jgi:hypothetical protein
VALELRVGMHVRPWKRGHMLDVGSLVLLVLILRVDSLFGGSEYEL